MVPICVYVYVEFQLFIINNIAIEFNQIPFSDLQQEFLFKNSNMISWKIWNHWITYIKNTMNHKNALFVILNLFNVDRKSFHEWMSMITFLSELMKRKLLLFSCYRVNFQRFKLLIFKLLIIIFILYRIIW